MNKKIIIFSIFAAIMLLLLPSISAIQNKTVQKTNKIIFSDIIQKIKNNELGELLIVLPLLLLQILLSIILGVFDIESRFTSPIPVEPPE